jgi:hypothetical protein
MALESPHLVDDLGLFGHCAERLGINPHGKDAQPDLPAGELNPVDVHREPQDLGERGGEMSEIAGRMEADQVRPQESPEQFVPFRQGAEQLFRGERDVKEEPDAGVRQPPAQQLRQKQELVVMHPDEIPRLIVLGHQLGEALVHLGIGFPVSDV